MPVTIEEAIARRMACAADEHAPCVWRDVGVVLPEVRASAVALVERTLEELDEAAHLEPLSEDAEAILRRAATEVLGAYRRERAQHLSVLLGTMVVPARDDARAAREKAAHLEAARRIDADGVRAHVLVDTLRADVAPRSPVTVFEIERGADVAAGPAGLHLAEAASDGGEAIGGAVPWSAIYAICVEQHGTPVSARVWPQYAPLNVLTALNHADGFPPFGGVDPPTEH